MSKGYNVIETENGITDLQFMCGEYDTMVSMNKCEEFCNNYFRCEYIKEANDWIVENID